MRRLAVDSKQPTSPATQHSADTVRLMLNVLMADLPGLRSLALNNNGCFFTKCVIPDHRHA
jgi:hypothetical protein